MIRLAITAPADVADRVLAALIEIAPSGVEQVDHDETVEFAVYGTPGELPELAEGEADVGGIRVTVSGTEVPDDWAERWKRFHTPILIQNRLYVRPPWEGPSSNPDVIDIEIDPGRAFGTGAHATTRLCLELLYDLANQGPQGSLCDLGCGSGVLAIAAAKLGYETIEALDADPLAIDATNLNAKDNGVTLQAVRRTNLRDEPAPKADVMTANLMRPLLLRVAQLMTHHPKTLILSGLLDHEADEVAAAFSPLTEQRRLSDRGWSALLMA